MRTSLTGTATEVAGFDLRLRVSQRPSAFWGPDGNDVVPTSGEPNEEVNIVRMARICWMKREGYFATGGCRGRRAD